MRLLPLFFIACADPTVPVEPPFESAIYGDPASWLCHPDRPDSVCASDMDTTVVYPDGSELQVEGVCPGSIATEERGDRGFGFDPLFIPDDGDGRTFSLMTDDEKNAISHRGRAFQALVVALRGTD